MRLASTGTGIGQKSILRFSSKVTLRKIPTNTSEPRYGHLTSKERVRRPWLAGNMLLPIQHTCQVPSYVFPLNSTLTLHLLLFNWLLFNFFLVTQKRSYRLIYQNCQESRLRQSSFAWRIMHKKETYLVKGRRPN